MSDEPPELARYDPAFVARVAGTAFRPLAAYFRLRITGLDEVPRGAALLVANHSGGMSPGDALFALAYHRHRAAPEPLYVLAHRCFTRSAAVGALLGRFGVVEASPANAIAALERGAKVLVYPGGDHDSLRPFSRRRDVDFGQRTGFVRLARRARVPIVPVTTSGAHETFVVVWQGKALARRLRLRRWLGLDSCPVILCLPWILAVGPMCLLPYWPLPARVSIHVGAARAVPPASRGERRAAAAAEAERVVQCMRDTLRRLHRERPPYRRSAAAQS